MCRRVAVTSIVNVKIGITVFIVMPFANHVPINNFLYHKVWFASRRYVFSFATYKKVPDFLRILNAKSCYGIARDQFALDASNPRSVSANVCKG